MKTVSKVLWFIIGLIAIERINLYYSSNCGNIQISCPYNPIIPIYLFSVSFIVLFIVIIGDLIQRFKELDLRG